MNETNGNEIIKNLIEKYLINNEELKHTINAELKYK